jgi:hypothetical protein
VCKLLLKFSCSSVLPTENFVFVCFAVLQVVHSSIHTGTHTFPPIKLLRYIAAMCYISLYLCPTVARWHKIIAYEDEVNMILNLKENSAQS